MDAAVRYIVAVQEHAGLDVVTDGEWWRKSYIGVIAELAHGFELGTAPDGRPWTVVVDKLAPKKPGFIAREGDFISQNDHHAADQGHAAGARAARRAHVGSGEIGEGLSQARRFRARLRADPATRAGADPRGRRGHRADRRSRTCACSSTPRCAASYANADAAADFAVETVNAIAEGGKGAKLAVHLCRRAGARVRGEAQFQGGYDPIINQLNRLKVHHLTMEFTAPGAGDMAVFKKLREDFEIGLGCVSVTPGEIDSAETIVARVQKATEFLAPERIVLNPDCGFAPGSGAAVSIDEAYRKLCNEVEAARMLREHFA